MRVALAVWDGRVSPVFDVARTVMIVDVQGGKVEARRIESIDVSGPLARLRRVAELGVHALVCGAISDWMRQELAAREVQVLGFVAGRVDDVLDAYLRGQLPSVAFSMPGYRAGPQPAGTPRRPGGRRRRWRGGARQ